MMRKTIVKEFGSLRPRAMVLDDNARARRMTSRRLKRTGFEVLECGTAQDFFEQWKPGTVDVIVADWQLSSDADELGDRILEKVRRRDWDVPFVLVSGKLDEDTERAPVLTRLLESGGARFVKRGTDGISQVCEEAEELIERRDLALLKIILSLREGALEGTVVQTTTGKQPVSKLLEEFVAKPSASHDASRPIAQALSQRKTNST